MRRDANRMLESVLDLGRGGTFQSRTERDIVVRTSLARLAQLDIGDQALCFGRIDRLPEDEGGRTESFHIGRLAVSGDDHEPLVVDWRAPVAEPFYRATGLDPQGLARRRHLAVQGRTVVGLEDETSPGPARHRVGAAAGPRAPATCWRTAWPSGAPAPSWPRWARPAPATWATSSATIQREQDEIIRAPLAGVLVVQGGPGTGKTAVALHRAAYLLYTHRFPLERQGVLVVGPNPLFLRYIEQVLPSLGETGVTLSTVSGLVPEVRVRGTEPPDVARLKGEARMARVHRPGRAHPPAAAPPRRGRPLRGHHPAPDGRRVGRRSWPRPAGGPVPTTPAAASSSSRSCGAWPTSTGGSAGTCRARRSTTDDWAEDPPAADELDVDEFGRQIRRVPSLAEALDRMWPRLAPHELLHDLLGARPLLAAAGKGILTSAELASLYRPRSASLDERPLDGGRRRPGRRGPGPARARAGYAPAARGPPPGSGPPGRARRWGSGRPGSTPTRRPVGARPPGGRRPCGPTATSWSTRSRTSRRCSCGCWPGARSRAR